MSEIDKDLTSSSKPWLKWSPNRSKGLKTKNAEPIAKNKKPQAGATVDPAEPGGGRGRSATS